MNQKIVTPIHNESIITGNYRVTLLTIQNISTQEN